MDNKVSAKVALDRVWTSAQAEIEADLVTVNQKLVCVLSLRVSPDAVLRAEPARRFISRGGVSGVLEQ